MLQEQSYRHTVHVQRRSCGSEEDENSNIVLPRPHTQLNIALPATAGMGSILTTVTLSEVVQKTDCNITQHHTVHSGGGWKL